MDAFYILIGSLVLGFLAYIALSLRSICKDVWEIKKHIENKEK